MTQLQIPQRTLDHAPAEQRDAQSDTSQPRINVNDQERMISAGVGAVLALVGITRRSVPGLLMAGVGGSLLYRAATGHCHLYEALGIDSTRSNANGAPPEAYFNRAIQVTHSFTINRTAEQLYTYWRKLENLPSILRHLDSVTVIDDRKSHWIAKGPLDMRWEWDAEIINDEPNRLIAWRSLGNADVDNAGSVTFIAAPGGRGTQVKVVIDYIPTGGRFGKIIAQVLGRDPSAEVCESLRDFKRFMETGEKPTTQGQSGGACVGDGGRA
ncbi:MAG TPA: YgaP-like transmembrane domain [Tepidisphaeraceae bacterium]|nr:YgaP-like transmembrane domain [Tepidisphaeraceae bacterium]